MYADTRLRVYSHRAFRRLAGNAGGLGLLQHARPQGVMDEPPFLRTSDQSGVFQNVQVVGHVDRRDAEHVRDLGDVVRAVGEEPHDLAA